MFIIIIIINAFRGIVSRGIVKPTEVYSSVSGKAARTEAAGAKPKGW